MHTIRLLLLVVLATTLSTTLIGGRRSTDVGALAPVLAGTGAELVPDEVVVELAPWVDATTRDVLARALGSELFDASAGADGADGVEPDGGAPIVLRVRAGWVGAVAALLESLPGVESAEANPLVHAFTTPNDPYFFPFQWSLYDRGTPSNGHASQFGIQAESAWDDARGTGAIVAVVDTGVAFEDRRGFRRAPQLARTRFVAPRNVIAGSAHPNDDHGHGTLCAEVIAARMNDGVGPAGIAPGCKIMPVKVLDKNGTGTAQIAAVGIRWAADHGAHVINLSLGGSSPSSAVKKAVNYAWQKGCVVVAASGNDGVEGVSYPARYVNCIAVGATRFDGGRAPYSNWGPELDVVAPGGDMSVDQNHDGYGDGILAESFSGNPSQFGYFLAQGTSLAAPHVSAVAALVKSRHRDFGNAQIRAAIEDSAFDLGADGRDPQFGAGLVDAAAAIR